MAARGKLGRPEIRAQAASTSACVAGPRQPGWHPFPPPPRRWTSPTSRTRGYTMGVLASR